MDSTGFNNMSQEILISVIKTIKSILNIDRSDVSLDANTKLLVDIPEFDSQAVISVITALEEKFDIEIDDDEINADVFDNIGSLTDFVFNKIYY